MKCPRCGGRVLPATDEHGEDDTSCVMCGFRVVPTWTAEALERIANALVKNGRTESSQRKAARKLAM